MLSPQGAFYAFWCLEEGIRELASPTSGPSFTCICNVGWRSQLQVTDRAGRRTPPRTASPLP